MPGRMDAPRHEKPKDVSHHFDFSDTEPAPAAEKPKGKKRPRSAPPVPVEAMRPRKRTP